MNRRFLGLLVLALLMIMPARGERLDKEMRKALGECVSRIADREVWGCTTQIESYSVRGRRLRLNFSKGLANYPFREERVEALYDSVRNCLGEKFEKMKIEIYTDGQPIEELIPLSERTSFDRRKVIPFTNPSRHPLVKNTSTPHTPTRGLQNRHLALWQSHGYYFDQGANRWRWQRTAQWMTREDLYTMGYVLPYLVPMLERAGAHVLLPRERDLHSWEGISDGDYPVSGYSEQSGEYAWSDGGAGFANPKSSYVHGENPFEMGRCRTIPSVMNPRKASEARWEVAVPERGEYALYVSYRSREKSTRQARYTVYHAGGASTLEVNQRIGGGSWVYLGTFDFQAGERGAVVTLTNLSDKAGEVVTADAVRIGGGMGNISRTPCDSLRRQGVEYREMLSGLPRYMEGSRYWLQWAGFSPTVYAGKGGKDDYKEDYMSRAHWVNALMGGSERLPDSLGLGIPVDMALAFHTDAGMRDSDETIGTLGIFYTKENKGEFVGGASRYRSRDLTDLVMTEIVEDIRMLWEPSWRRRGLWNRAYYEARIPSVPTMLLELLSHQNFADMRYGHDPRFKFAVSRSIYKGILKHIATQYGYDYVVQPLPVQGFSVALQPENEVLLNWEPRIDSLEVTAAPTAYILYTAIDEAGFDAGRVVEGCSLRLKQEVGHHYRYRLSAINAGGESFPSETLGAYIQPEAENKGNVLIVNGFTRVSAPSGFRTEQEAGFSAEPDRGVSYLYDAGYIGDQNLYERALWQEADPEAATGGCLRDCEGVIRRGNTFDYPTRHGLSIAAAGYSYASSSLHAFEQGQVDCSPYRTIDLILGQQRAVTLAHGAAGYEFKSFSPELQSRLRELSDKGCSLLISGCYPASDLWQSECSGDSDRRFAREVLHYEYGSMLQPKRGVVRSVAPEVMTGELHLNLDCEGEVYAAESVDALWPVGRGAFSALRYGENNRVAAVGYAGGEYRSLVLGFPIESITSIDERNKLMDSALRFLNNEQ